MSVNAKIHKNQENYILVHTINHNVIVKSEMTVIILT